MKNSDKAIANFYNNTIPKMTIDFCGKEEIKEFTEYYRKANSRQFVDFHMHSKYSDGLHTPRQITEEAIDKNFRAIAITDHNQFAFGEIFELQKEFADMIHIVNGTEVTCTHVLSNGKVLILHLVLLFFDPENPELNNLFEEYSSFPREAYAKATLEKLKEFGYHITFEELSNAFPDTPKDSLGRKHIAILMSQKYPEFETCAAALDQYVGKLGERKAYIPETDFFHWFDLQTAVEIGKKAKALIILAHPFFYGLSDRELAELLVDFKNIAGEAAGIECFYKDYNAVQTAYLVQAAAKYNYKFVSCGSDCHHADKEELMPFPVEIYEHMKKYHKKLYGTL